MLRLYRIGGFRGGARGAHLLSFLGRTEAQRAIKKPFLRPPGFFGAGVNIISLLSAYLASSPREFNTVLHS